MDYRGPERRHGPRAKTEDVIIGSRKSDDVITETGPHWAAMKARIDQLEKITGQALGASARVERAVMGYWDEEKNEQKPGLWTDVWTIKREAAAAKTLAKAAFALLWSVVLIVLTQFANTLFGWWGSAHAIVTKIH